MNRQERLKAVYEHLRQNGMVHTQKDFADALGKAEGTMSKAFKGDEKALTNNLMLQITVAFPGVFNVDWLLSGDGDMCVTPKIKTIESLDPGSIFNSMLAAKQETIDVLKNDIATKEAYIKDLQQSNKELRARIYALEHADDLKKYPFDLGVSDPTEDHQTRP